MIGTGGASQPSDTIQLFEGDINGNPDVPQFPPEVREFRRVFLVAQVLGRLGSTKAAWATFIVGLCHAAWRRSGSFWARGVVAQYCRIHDDPDELANSEDNVFSMSRRSS